MSSAYLQHRNQLYIPPHTCIIKFKLFFALFNMPRVCIGKAALVQAFLQVFSQACASELGCPAHPFGCNSVKTPFSIQC